MSRGFEAQIALHVTPRRALSAFLNHVDLRGWWGVERSLVQPQVGGLYALAWGVTGQGFRYATTGIVREYEQDRVLDITHYTYFGSQRLILGPMQLTVSAEGRAERECMRHCFVTTDHSL